MLESRINQLIRSCRASINSMSVSDIHITAGDHPWLRVDGILRQYKRCSAFTVDDIKLFVDDLLTSEADRKYQAEGFISVAIHEETYGDVRIHVQRVSTGSDLIIRLLNPEVPAFARLNLPQKLLDLADYANGLILFTGATGSGKSTALAALINEINQRKAYKIYTVEDPIEYQHTSQKSMIQQISIGADVRNYDEALKSFLRADPDVILVGEMRDRQTMKAAMQAAETGHLVFSTMHDNSAADTVQRIINSFPGDEQKQIQSTLAAVLRAIISLKLVPRASGQGRLPVVEILIANTSITNAISKAEYQTIYGTMENGRSQGMQTMEKHLKELVAKGEITREVANMNANRPEALQ